MHPSAATIERYSSILLGVAVLVGLFLSGIYSYLLFHSVAEVFAIVVAAGIFMVAWNSRRFLENHYLLLVGIAYLFVAAVDLVHMLAYKDMGVFATTSANLATQLWIAARYLQSASLLVAALFIRRRLNVRVTLVAYAALTALLLASIFYWNVFPACYVEGSGLTSFKKASEVVIILMLIAALGLLVRRRAAFEPDVFGLLVASIGVTALSELAFTSYQDVFGLLNMTGHFLKVVAFFLIYKALVETGLARPYDLLFRDLKQSEQTLKTERDFTSAVLDIAGALVVVLDREGRIIRFNRACEQTTGYRSHEVERQHFWDLFLVPEEYEPVKAVFHNLRAGQFPLQYENYWKTKTGELRLIAWSNTSLQDEQGRVEYIIATGIDITERRRVELENLKLYEQSRRLAVLEERQRLARDLHDSVSQTLYAIALGANTALQLVGSETTRLTASLDYILTLADTGLTEMRALIFDLRPESLETEGLVGALHKQAGSIRARYGVEVVTELDGEPELPVETKEALYRIAQEALNNTVKHACARRVKIGLTYDAGEVALEVSDDGRGFEAARSFPGHLGLQSMRERAEKWGGTSSIESAPGRGTLVRTRIPLPIAAIPGKGD